MFGWLVRLIERIKWAKDPIPEPISVPDPLPGDMPLEEPEDIYSEAMKISLMIARMSRQYNLDAMLIKAVIRTESNFDPMAHRFEPGFYRRYIKDNPDYANHPLLNEPERISASLGLMQIMYTTAIEYGFDKLGNPDDLYNITTNLEYGCKILNEKISRYGLQLGILSYNSGSPKRGVAARQQPNYIYLKKVAKFYKKYGGANQTILNHA